MRAALWLLVLGGCDRLFGLDTVPAPDIDAPTTGCMLGSAHDDDGDCVADAVDNCPGMPNPAQHDQDDDKIGDVCDPDPLTKGNKLLAFVPNTDPATLSSWAINGAWSITGDALANADTIDSGEDWAYWNQQELAPVEVETIVHIDTLGALDNRIGVAYAVPPTNTGLPASEYSCAIRRADDGVHLDAYATTATAQEPLIPNAALQDGAVYTLRARVDTNGLQCELQGASPGERQTAQIGVVIPMAGRAAVYTFHTAAHYDSIAVYSVIP